MEFNELFDHDVTSKLRFILYLVVQQSNLSQSTRNPKINIKNFHEIINFKSDGKTNNAAKISPHNPAHNRHKNRVLIENLASLKFH